jgi:poly [ADP-ribose] polymerase 7/11/12/13
MEFLRKRLSKESGEQLTEVAEKQLFHGTRDERAVQSIFRQNFDWRLYGSSNDYVYGRGTYFARNAKFSDRYSAQPIPGSRLSWMFLARVLVGRSAVGVREYVRPPPLNARVPDGELYDSCVNDLAKPQIYVIFDIDQCYPEYVISYTVA